MEHQLAAGYTDIQNPPFTGLYNSFFICVLQPDVTQMMSALRRAHVISCDLGYRVSKAHWQITIIGFLVIGFRKHIVKL